MAFIQSTLPFDICENRHKGNSASRDAMKRGDKARDEMWVLKLIQEAGWNGITSKEIASAMYKPLNAISGRCSALLAKGLIFRNGDRRDGCFILRAQ